MYKVLSAPFVILRFEKLTDDHFTFTVQELESVDIVQDVGLGLSNFPEATKTGVVVDVPVQESVYVVSPRGVAVSVPDVFAVTGVFEIVASVFGESFMVHDAVFPDEYESAVV